MSWRDRALCAEIPGDVFFPEPRQSSLPAKSICERCPVKQECLFDALFEERELWFGVRGGLTPRERRELLRKTKRGVA